MDKITEIACKADLLFGLKPALEKFDFVPEEDLFISFKYKDKEVKTGAIPRVFEGRTSALNSETLKATVLDWLNKAEMQYEYSRVYGKELGLPDKGDFDVTIKFTSKSNEFVLKGAKVCWPCFRGAGFCCVC